jgi:DNA-binding CsgD family transcriptional regulator
MRGSAAAGLYGVDVEVHAEKKRTALPMSKPYKHVSLAERIEIEKLLDRVPALSQAEIARRLGRSPSTICP